MSNFLLTKLKVNKTTIPAATGEMNHEPTIDPNLYQFIPFTPLATNEKPTHDPTIEWVPDTGSFRKVAINCQTPEAAMALRKPNMRSDDSPLYNPTSKMPFRIVSPTWSMKLYSANSFL